MTAALCAGVASALTAVGYVIAVGTSSGLYGDGAAVPHHAEGGLFRWILSASMHSLTPLSAGLGIAVVAALGWRGGRRTLLAVVVLLAGSGISATALELVLEAADPLRAEHRRALGAGFFPSGHSTAAMALVLGAALATTGRRQTALTVLGSIGAGLLGIGNLVTESHHPSDVLAGYLLAAAWAAAAIPLLPAATPPRDPMRRVCRALAAGLAVPAVVVAGFVLERPPDEVGDGFLAAAVAVALTAAAVPAVVVAIARRPGRSAGAVA